MLIRSTSLLASVFAAALVGAAAAADRLPDRRAVGPAQVVPVANATSRNDAMLDLLNELEDLKQQVRQLRGQLEVQGHQLEQLKNGQRQSLIDIDQRLRELEQGSRSGTASAARTPSLGSSAPSAGIATASPPATSTSSGVRSAPTAPEQRQYDAAFTLMKQGRYQQAAARFREFVARNPKSALADNAQYWVGEAAYVTRDFRTALEEFGKVLTNYPQSPKVPDALLKIGYSHYELAAYDRARQTLKQVVARYPNTVVAKSAEVRLEKMNREGQ